MIRRNIIRLFVTLAALTAFAGCGGSPLIGRWSRTQTTATFIQKLTLTFGGDGSLGIAIAGMGDCTGSMNITGPRWSATATQVTTTGTAQCTGMLTCTAAGNTVNIDCSMASSQPTGMPENFSISGNTLTLASNTYTRE